MASEQFHFFNNLSCDIVEFFVNVKWRTPLGVLFRVRAILVHNVAVHIVLQVIAKDVHSLLLKDLLLEHKQRLNTTIEASNHRIGTTDINLWIIVIVEIIDPRMFKVLSHN